MVGWMDKYNDISVLLGDWSYQFTTSIPSCQTDKGTGCISLLGRKIKIPSVHKHVNPLRKF